MADASHPQLAINRYKNCPRLADWLKDKMSHLNPHKLHTDFSGGASQNGPLLPRSYTLTHSDITGDLFLTVAQQYNLPQISGLYTRLMRDEVLAQWDVEENVPSLHVHCHVSGGMLIGSANWRESIFHRSYAFGTGILTLW